MPQSYPSAQSFYKREVATSTDAPTQPELSSTSDGFTEQELADAQDPLSREWNPEREYDEMTVDKLIPGPLAVTCVGRIVNFTTILGSSQKEKSASGWHYLLFKDDTAVISIKLYFAPHPYPLKLGSLLSIWTSFIASPSKHEPSNIPNVFLYANMFPGRVTSDHIIIHTSDSTTSICRYPLDYRKSQPLPGLMALSSYLTGGHDGVTGAKILVCLKSIGARKKIARKAGGNADLLEVLLFDHTGEVRMTLWDAMVESVKDWQPGKTVFLISNPGFRVALNGGKGTLGVVRGTMIDVDPCFPDAEWLRRYAAGLTKKESLCVEWKEGVWDVEAAEEGINRMLFTLAELDTWVRMDGNSVFTGFINVIILDMSLASLQRRNMLMCAECCGIPTFSNSPSTPCLHCHTPLTLSLNPKLVGTLLDETGSIAPGKLLWSPRAWEQLFNRPIEAIAGMSADDAKHFEMKLLGMRLHFVVGWAGDGDEGGRLGVLGVMS